MHGPPRSHHPRSPRLRRHAGAERLGDRRDRAERVHRPALGHHLRPARLRQVPGGKRRQRQPTERRRQHAAALRIVQQQLGNCEAAEAGRRPVGYQEQERRTGRRAQNIQREIIGVAQHLIRTSPTEGKFCDVR